MIAAGVAVHVVRHASTVCLCIVMSLSMVLLLDVHALSCDEYQMETRDVLTVNRS